MRKRNGWEVDVLKSGTIRISNERYGYYGFHPHDLSIEDRMKMIRTLSMTNVDDNGQKARDVIAVMEG